MIPSASNLGEQFGNVSGRISHQHSLELEPFYSAPQCEASNFIVPPINFWVLNVPQPSAAKDWPNISLSASRLLDNVDGENPLALKLEHANLARAHKTHRYITPLVNRSGWGIPAPTILTTSPLVSIFRIPVSLASRHAYSAMLTKAPLGIIPQIDLSSINISEPIILLNSSFDPTARNPLKSQIELTGLAPLPKALLRITPSIDMPGINTPSSSCSATSSLISLSNTKLPE